MPNPTVERAVVTYNAPARQLVVTLLLSDTALDELDGTVPPECGRVVREAVTAALSDANVAGKVFERRAKLVNAISWMDGLTQQLREREAEHDAALAKKPTAADLAKLSDLQTEIDRLAGQVAAATTRVETMQREDSTLADARAEASYLAQHVVDEVTADFARDAEKLCDAAGATVASTVGVGSILRKILTARRMAEQAERTDGGAIGKEVLEQLLASGPKAEPSGTERQTAGTGK